MHMMDYNEFKKKYLSKLFFNKKVDENIIEKDYDIFIDNFNSSKNLTLNFFSKNIPLFDFGGAISNDDIYNIDNKVLNETFDVFIEKQYFDKTLKNDNVCLKSKLIGSACLVKNQKDIFGVITDIERKLLVVDIGESSLKKYSLENLRIVGQTR